MLSPVLEGCEAETLLLNFEGIQLVEMTIAMEVFLLLTLRPFPGKVILLEGLGEESILNIQVVLAHPPGHGFRNLILPHYERGRITFICHLQPHLQEFWAEIQGEAVLQAPAIAQRLGNDNLRLFHQLGVLKMRVEKGLKTYSPLTFVNSAASEALSDSPDSAQSPESVEEPSPCSCGSSDSIESPESPDSINSAAPMSSTVQRPYKAVRMYGHNVLLIPNPGYVPRDTNAVLLGDSANSVECADSVEPTPEPDMQPAQVTWEAVDSLESKEPSRLVS